MLILFLFCPLIEAAKVSEKIAVATLATEFMEPWQEQICIMNPDPEVWLWKEMDYPEMQFVPLYEVVNDTNLERLLKRRGQGEVIFLDLDHSSVSDRKRAMKIKQKVKNGALVLSKDPCLRRGPEEPTTSGRPNRSGSGSAELDGSVRFGWFGRKSTTKTTSTTTARTINYPMKINETCYLVDSTTFNSNLGPDLWICWKCSFQISKVRIRVYDFLSFQLF